MYKLSERLLAIQKRITKKDSIICDVGCDHCYTSIYALKEGKAKFAYNIDVNKEPLATGIRNIKNENLENKTENFIANGLYTNKIKEKLDYVIISGLGGNTIIKIINDRNKELQIDNFICVANDHADVVRKFVMQNDLRIKFEEIIESVYESKTYYFHLIQISNTGLKVSSDSDILFGPYNLKHRSKNFIKY
jgi:tRNA (adenine22-N1)-methyltransferase